MALKVNGTAQLEQLDHKGISALFLLVFEAEGGSIRNRLTSAAIMKNAKQ